MRAAAADLMMCDPDLSLIRSLTSPRPFEKIRIRGSCFLRVRTLTGSIKKGASLGVKLAFFSWTTTMTPIDNNFLSFQLNTESKPYGIQ